MTDNSNFFLKLKHDFVENLPGRSWIVLFMWNEILYYIFIWLWLKPILSDSLDEISQDFLNEV